MTPEAVKLKYNQYKSRPMSQSSTPGKPKAVPDRLGLEKYGRRLHQFVIRRLRNKADVNDIVQEAYLRILQRDPSGELVRDPLGYLYATCGNAVTRANMREGERSLVVFDDRKVEEALKTPAKYYESDAYGLLSAWQSFRKLLRSLPRPLRLIFFLDRVRNLSDAEIAERTGYSIHTVRTYRTKARILSIAWKDE